MKTLFLVLSTLWTLARNTPVILRHLPAAIALVGKIRALFGSEAVQELMQALHAFLDRMAPSAPAADRVIPENPKQEERRRRFRFRNRLEVAGIMTDAEERMLCSAHRIQPDREELA